MKTLLIIFGIIGILALCLAFVFYIIDGMFYINETEEDEDKDYINFDINF